MPDIQSIMAGDLSGKDDVVLLTPSGRGAVATVIVQGSTSAKKADRLFRSASGRALQATKLGHVAYGTWQLRPDRREEVVVCRRDEYSVEIHCHGGRVVTQALIDSLVELDCESVSWQAWSMNIHGDALAAAARAALAEARTRRTAEILLDQYRGALRNAFGQCISFLTATNFAAAIKQLEALHQQAALGEHLTRPWQVVVAGQPNVGKSSLINAILGYQRSIVFDQPGTTRDVVTATTALEGWPVEMRDTAGLRTSDDEIEVQGVQLARQQIAAADSVILVFDVSRPMSSEDRQLRNETESIAKRMIVVYNKHDIAQELPPDHELQVSAKTGSGVDQLIAAVSASLVPHPPPSGAAVPFTREQSQVIEEALALSVQGNAQQAIAALSAVTDV